jgi:hypothetical protein
LHPAAAGKPTKTPLNAVVTERSAFREPPLRIAPIGQFRQRAARRSHRPEVIGGVTALAVSATLPLVVRVLRRHHVDEPGDDSGPAVAVRPDPPASAVYPARPRVTPLHPRVNPARPQRSEYGLGFDQHRAHERGRPIAWVVVGVIILGSCASGISLIESAPWLFWTGVGLVVLSMIVGRASLAMRDELTPLPGASEPRPTSGRSAPAGEHR